MSAIVWVVIGYGGILAKYDEISFNVQLLADPTGQVFAGIQKTTAELPPLVSPNVALSW